MVGDIRRVTARSVMKCKNGVWSINRNTIYNNTTFQYAFSPFQCCGCFTCKILMYEITPNGVLYLYFIAKEKKKSVEKALVNLQ